MKKILLIAPQPFYCNRGTPMNVRAVASTRADAGYGVHLLVYPFGEDIKIPGVTIHRAARPPFIAGVPIGPSWKKLICDVGLCATAARLALRHSFDAFHGIEEGGIIAGVLAAAKRRPYVYDMDSNMTVQLRTSSFRRIPGFVSLIERIDNMFIRRAASVITVCAALTESAAKVRDPKGIHQIEDFPVETSLDVRETFVSELRARLLLDGKKVMLYTGNLEEYQGVQLLIRAFGRFLEGSPDERLTARLLIVGGEVEQVAECLALAREHGCSAETILPGKQPLEDMGSYMALANVLCSPRELGENTPLKIFTYMATGTPILATNIRSHTQVLSSESAFLAEPNETSLAAAIREVLDASDLGRREAVRRGECAAELARTRYSYERFQRQVRAVYTQLFPNSAESVKYTGVASELLANDTKRS
ncbi:MAG: glycosyltransferase [Deltaproteobacteria bacterium]|nr:glycosyltransferase [Deltaproteobacteria bacterium]